MSSAKRSFAKVMRPLRSRWTMTSSWACDQAAIALLGLGEAPGTVLEALDLRFESKRMARQAARPH